MLMSRGSFYHAHFICCIPLVLFSIVNTLHSALDKHFPICGCWLFWYGLFSTLYILMSAADHIRGVLNDLCPYRSLCRVPCGLNTLLYMLYCCKLDSIPDTGFTARNKIDVNLENLQVTAL